MPRNSVSSKTIRDNGGRSIIDNPLREIGGKPMDYDHERFRFDGGIEDTREIPWDDMFDCYLHISHGNEKMENPPHFTRWAN